MRNYFVEETWLRGDFEPTPILGIYSRFSGRACQQKTKHNTLFNLHAGHWSNDYIPEHGLWISGRYPTLTVVNDAVVCQIVSSCPRLKRLTLKNNQRITDTSIEYMCNHEHMAQLQSLNISKCSLLTDLSIHSILHSKFQSTLTVLKVNDCMQFSTAVLSMITVSHMPQLSRLECYRTLMSELESFEPKNPQSPSIVVPCASPSLSVLKLQCCNKFRDCSQFKILPFCLRNDSLLWHSVVMITSSHSLEVAAHPNF